MSAHSGAAALQLLADSKFLQQESLVELVKAIVHSAGPLQRLSATPESMENAEVNCCAPERKILSCSGVPCTLRMSGDAE